MTFDITPWLGPAIPTKVSIEFVKGPPKFSLVSTHKPEIYQIIRLDQMIKWSNLSSQWKRSGKQWWNDNIEIIKIYASNYMQNFVPHVCAYPIRIRRCIPVIRQPKHRDWRINKQ